MNIVSPPAMNSGSTELSRVVAFGGERFKTELGECVKTRASKKRRQKLIKSQCCQLHHPSLSLSLCLSLLVSVSVYLINKGLSIEIPFN